MKKSQSNQASQSAGETVSVAIRNSETGRFMGSWKLELGTWRMIGQFAKKYNLTRSDLLNKAFGVMKDNRAAATA